MGEEGWKGMKVGEGDGDELVGEDGGDEGKH